MSASDAAPACTPLYALHLELGARMVPFAGYALPVQYARGIRHEHVATRNGAGLFDVSHMGQVSCHVPAAALEALVPSDIASLAVGQQRYSVLTNDEGGIRDDLMILRLAERFHLVVNAAFKHADIAHLRGALPVGARVDLHEDRALLALQGPRAAEVMERYAPGAARLAFMQGGEFDLAGVSCVVTRSGYTGEDGFEIGLAADAADGLARSLLGEAGVEPVGLGARDSLRLEAGLCLSGADIDAHTTPGEAGLGWVVARKYLDGGVPAHFPGAARILDERRHGAARQRVGIRMRGRVPARAGAVLHDGSGREVGRITSGGFAPTLDAPIAMGYVERAAAVPGSALEVSIRDTVHAADVVALPFVPHRYRR